MEYQVQLSESLQDSRAFYGLVENQIKILPQSMKMFILLLLTIILSLIELNA